MKVKFLAAGRPSPVYEFNGETVNGFDLSALEHGGRFIGNLDTKKAGIRDVYRDEVGELHVTLFQTVIASKISERKAHWREGAEIDVADYEPTKCYVIPTGVSDLVEGKDYNIVQDVDVAGTVGWTIKQLGVSSG